jgi:hypothetical protein
MDRRSEAYSVELFPERGVTVTCDTELDSIGFQNYKTHHPDWLDNHFDIDEESEYKFHQGQFTKIQESFINPCDLLDVTEYAPSIYTIRTRSRSRNRSRSRARNEQPNNNNFLRFGDQNNSSRANESSSNERHRSRSRGREPSIKEEEDAKNFDDNDEEMIAFVFPMSEMVDDSCYDKNNFCE